MSKRIIASFNVDGSLVRTYESTKIASKSLRVNPRSIDKAIREHTLLKDRQWIRCDELSVPTSISMYQKSVTSRSIKPICEIDEHNKVINTYPSIRRASILNHTDAHTIRDVLNHKTSKANGKIYRYLDDEEIIKYGYQKGNEISLTKVAVIQLNKDGKYIKSYKSILEACKAIGENAKPQAIKNCLNGKFSTAYGYVWKYKDKQNVKRKSISIYQVDINGALVKKYKSVKDASMDTGISVSFINNCLRGRQKRAGGYIWKRH